MTKKVQRKLLYSPKSLMVGGGLIKEDGKPNTQLYNQWLYRGIFGADKEADGPGTVSLYSFENILHVAIVVRLRDFYIPLKKATRIAEQIIEMKNKLVNKTNDIFTVFPKKNGGLEVKLGDKDFQSDAIRLNVRNIENEVDERLETLGDTENIGKYFPISNS